MRGIVAAIVMKYPLELKNFLNSIYHTETDNKTFGIVDSYQNRFPLQHFSEKVQVGYFHLIFQILLSLSGIQFKN